jgi:centrosomal CEP192-like protein/immunoglobulin I-set domain protein
MPTGEISRGMRKCALATALLLLLGNAAHAYVGATPRSLAFGDQTVGSTSAKHDVTIANQGRRAVTISRIVASAAQFSFSAPSLPLTLEPGHSLTVAVIFRPSAAQTYSGRLEFERTSGWPISIGLTGTGTGGGITSPPPPPAVAPAISSQPAGAAIIAGQAARFTVAATGTAPIAYQWMKNGTAIAGANSPTYTTPTETTADNQAKFTVKASNSAGSAMSNAATLTVNSATFLLSASSSSLSFGSVNLSSSKALTVTVANSGNSTVTVSNVTVSGAGFDASGVSSGLILTPGQTATLAATFSPSASGNSTGNVSIASNATNSPDSISLLGTGVAVVAHSVQLSWAPSTSTVVGYNAYWSAQSGGPYTKLTNTVDSALTYTDSSVQAGQSYYFVVTSVDSNNNESAYSNEVTAVVP